MEAEFAKRLLHKQFYSHRDASEHFMFELFFWFIQPSPRGEVFKSHNRVVAPSFCLNSPLSSTRCLAYKHTFLIVRRHDTWISSRHAMHWLTVTSDHKRRKQKIIQTNFGSSSFLSPWESSVIITLMESCKKRQ